MQNITVFNAFQTSKHASNLARRGETGEALNVIETFLTAGGAPDSHLLFQAARLLVAFAASMPEKAATHYAKAKTYLENALEQNPANSFCLQLLGDIEAETGDYPSALNHYLSALKMDKKPAVLMGKICGIMLRQGDIAGAEQWAQKQLDRDPGDCKAMGLMTQILLAKGDIAGAEQWAQKKLDRDPGDCKAMGLMTQILLAKGDTAGAEQWAQKQLDRDPGDCKAIGLMTQILLAKGDTAGAARWTEKLLQHDPSNAIGILLKGRMSLYRNDKSTALSCAMQLAEKPFHHAHMFFLKALALHGILDRSQYSMMLGQLKQTGNIRPNQRDFDLDFEPEEVLQHLSASMIQGPIDLARYGGGSVFNQDLIPRPVNRVAVRAVTNGFGCDLPRIIIGEQTPRPDSDF